MNDVSENGWFLGERGDRRGVVVKADGSVRWRMRAHLAAFSPDESQVLAVQRGHQISLLRARSGAETAQLDMTHGIDVLSAVWETNRTLLALMRHNGRVAVVRVHADGRVERATRPRRVTRGEYPYLTLTRS